MLKQALDYPCEGAVLGAYHMMQTPVTMLDAQMSHSVNVCKADVAAPSAPPLLMPSQHVAA